MTADRVPSLPERAVAGGPARVLMTGPPGAGKSTVAPLVAQHFDRSVVIPGDLTRETIVGGFEAPRFPFDDALLAQFALGRRIVCDWVESVAAEGYVAIVDDAPVPPVPHFHDQFAPLLDHPDGVGVLLAPSADVARDRIRVRAGGAGFDDFLLRVVDQAYELIEGWDLGGWHVVDSTDLSATETATAVVEAVRGG